MTQYTNKDGSVTNGVVLEVDGKPITSSNPLPTSGGGGGGGGGAVTEADGANVALGATTSPSTGTGAATTVIGALRALRDRVLASTAWPTSVADGDNASIGAKADTVYGGSGAASVIAILKAVYAACVAATPAGSNLIGKVNAVPGATTYTDRKGSITTGGTAQAFAPAVGTRTGFSFQNISSGDLYLLENAASATAASATSATVKVPAGGYYYNDPGFVPQGIISVFGATTGQSWLGKDF